MLKAWVLVYPANAQVAVIGVPDEHMANDKVPRQVRFLETLSVNASNKVDKKLLRAA